METRTLKKLLSVAWVVLGCGQALSAASRGSWLFFGLGVVYALLGVLYFWFEVYAIGR